MEAINETTARSQSFAYVQNVRNQTYQLRVESPTQCTMYKIFNFTDD